MISSTCSAWGTRPRPCPGPCPVGSDSAWPSPGPWPTSRPCCLADEPTGALDSDSGHEIVELLSRLHHGGQTIVLVTHDNDVAQAAEHLIYMRDGQHGRGARPEAGGRGARGAVTTTPATSTTTGRTGAGPGPGPTPGPGRGRCRWPVSGPAWPASGVGNVDGSRSRSVIATEGGLHRAQLTPGVLLAVPALGVVGFGFGKAVANGATIADAIRLELTLGWVVAAVLLLVRPELVRLGRLVALAALVGAASFAAAVVGRTMTGGTAHGARFVATLLPAVLMAIGVHLLLSVPDGRLISQVATGRGGLAYAAGVGLRAVGLVRAGPDDRHRRRGRMAGGRGGRTGRGIPPVPLGPGHRPSATAADGRRGGGHRRGRSGGRGPGPAREVAGPRLGHRRRRDTCWCRWAWPRATFPGLLGQVGPGAGLAADGDRPVGGGAGRLPAGHPGLRPRARLRRPRGAGAVHPGRGHRGARARRSSTNGSSSSPSAWSTAPTPCPTTWSRRSAPG